MKTFEQFKSDIDPYGEEEWDDSKKNIRSEQRIYFKGEYLPKREIIEIVKDQVIEFFRKNPERDVYYYAGIMFLKNEFDVNENKEICEEWIEEEFSIGEHKIVLTQDYTFDFYKSRRDIDEDGREVWLEDELFKLNSKAGDELIVDIVDIDPGGLFDDVGDQIITISYDDETGYRGVALVPLKIIKIKE